MVSPKKIPPEILKKIRDSINLIELVGESVVLRKTGHTYKGLCPFHSERTPSFHVNEAKQFYHCFGCQRHGDIFQFVIEQDGVSFPEAVEILAERARVPLPQDWSQISQSGVSPEAAARRAAEQEKIALAYRLNRFASAFYHRQLKSSPAVELYFQKRGVDEVQQRHFYAGFAPGGWDALARELTEKKAPLELAHELGLIRPSQKGMGPMDLFRGRAMFPILDMRGRVAGFGGRILPDEEKNSSGAPKYLNSPESLIFKKSKLAFGLFQAQKEIREQDEVVLVEGYFDVVALHAAGFKNVISPCGTALGVDLLGVLRRLSQKITIVFDGDAAGVAGTDRAMELGLENGIVFYGISLPEGLDPDQMVIDETTGKVKEEGVRQLREWLAGARPILDTRIQQEAMQAKDHPEAKAQALKKIATWLSKYSDPVGRNLRVESLPKLLGVSPGLVAQALGNAGVRGVISEKKGGAQSSPPSVSTGRRETRGPKAKVTPSEKLLLAGVVADAELERLFRAAQNQIPQRKTLADLWGWGPAHDWVSGVFLMQSPGKSWELSEVEDPELRSFLGQALMTQWGDERKNEWKKALEWRIAWLWARFSQEIHLEVKGAEARNDLNLQEKLLQEYLDVQRKIVELKDFYDEAE